MVLLTEVSGTLLSGFMSYFLKIVMYGIVAAAGIAIGIHLRKKKNLEESESASDEK